MNFHCALAKAQLLDNLPVSKAVNYRREDLSLAPRQFLNRRSCLGLTRSEGDTLTTELLCNFEIFQHFFRS